MALQFYRRAEQLYHLLVRQDDYLFAGLYNNMSSLFEKMGRNEEALSFLMRALGILQNFPDRQMEAATNFTNLALLYLKMGDCESGKKCAAQAVSMFETLNAPASHYSAALSALGEICYRGKEYGQAIDWYGRTLSEIEKHYGFNLAYAVVCENLAHVYREAGRAAKEAECLEKAAKIRARLGEENGGAKAEGAKNTGERENRAGSEAEKRARDIEKVETTGRSEAEKSAQNTEKVETTERSEAAKRAECERKSAGTALQKCRVYYERYGKPLLKQFPEVRGHFAAGLVGEGSECFGYDDGISADHDYFPRFFIWLDDEAYEKYAAPLQEAYRKLPAKWSCCDGAAGRRDGCGEEAADTVMTPEGALRCGVCRTKDFYFRLLGRETPPENLYDWLSMQETRLATATNGEVFEDCGGGFTALRSAYLAYFPEDVRKKKLAARLRKMAQMGQYQYARCMQRGEYVAAQMALAEFIENAGSACFLLAGRYTPYFKWMHRAMRELPVLSGVADKLEKLTLLSSQHDKWDTENPKQCRFQLNMADEKVALIEEIAGMIAEELRRQGLADGWDTYLESYAAEVELRIEDSVLRMAGLV